MSICMKCDLCDKPAVVHETTVKNGVKNEVHLCEQHAAAAGIDMPSGQPVQQLLTQLVICKGKEPAVGVTRKACRSCGMAFKTFRQTGLLGCPDCYEAFEEQLDPMIERAQGGAVSHSGKCPKRGAASLERHLRVKRLFDELEDAVAAEEYERAAELRDQLRALEPERIDGPRGGEASPSSSSEERT